MQIKTQAAKKHDDLVVQLFFPELKTTTQLKPHQIFDMYMLVKLACY